MPGSKSTATIDRLCLDVPGLSEKDARHVAQLVAAGLADAGALPQVGDLPKLSVAITVDRRTDASTLARHIVVATLRELARTV
jgi:hypothetical protein